MRVCAGWVLSASGLWAAACGNNPDAGANGAGGSVTNAAGGTGGVPGPHATGGASGNAGNPGPVPVSGPPPDPGALGVVRISEVMYHPVLEEAEFETHEFVELHNPSTQEISLTGAKLKGGIEFSFSDGSSIAAGGFLVVAKDKPAFDALYPTATSLSVGGYNGQLGNGGDTIRLTAPNGGIADEVAYADSFPWPAAADALGVGRRWLRPGLLPREQHRHRGYSLERVNFAGSGKDPASWASSMTPVPTPGKPNSSGRDTMPPLVRQFSALSSVSGTKLIAAADQVRVIVEFDHTSAVKNVTLEWFVDVLGQRGEVTTKTPMLADPADAKSFSATLPPHPANSVVRYRVLAEDQTGPHVFLPREREPQEWHGYFVAPQLPNTTRTYHLFVEPDDWAQLWENIRPGREAECKPQPTWNDTVPGRFVFEGEVIDVQVRYQGSRYQRPKGAVNDPLEIEVSTPLSVRIAFPRYHHFEGQNAFVLNKLVQGCPGLSAGLGFKLFELAGIPAAKVRYARLQLNGAYYNYAMQLERPGERLLERWHNARAESGFPAESIGELYKAAGANKDAGPWGPGNGTKLSDHCGYPALERYGYTYELKTNEWADPTPVKTLIEEMHVARAAGLPAMRSFVEKNFDLELTLTYLALRNWAGPWDDIFHNYFLYRSRTTGKWIFIPWDLDRQFEWADSDESVFLGEENHPERGNWNYFKDTILNAYRGEYLARLRELNGTLLLPERVAPILNEHFRTADFAEAQLSPTGLVCDAQASLSKMLEWTKARQIHVATGDLDPPLPVIEPEQPENPEKPEKK